MSYKDENLLYCQNEEQFANYKLLIQMGFQISDVVFGGVARIWRDGTTVEVPLTVDPKVDYSFSQHVFGCILRHGREQGKSEIRGKLKDLLKI